jgi:hypothetical protein
MDAVTYRRAGPEDFPAILWLQSANHIANLAEEQRKEGFLSAKFTEAQVAAMAGDLGIMLAIVENNVAGFLCAFRRDFDHGSPVLAKMFECYELVEFQGKPLGRFTNYVYGPVCVARHYRRQGLLRGLSDAQKKDLRGQFEVGVAFVSRSNPHSLQAHVGGLGMTQVGEFTVNDNSYVILAFSVAQK